MDDVYFDGFREYEQLFDVKTEPEDDSSTENSSAEYLKKRDYSIEEIIREGQEILVQAAKSPMGNQRCSHFLVYIAARSIFSFNAHFRSYRRFPSY